jgi:predicted RNA binding protein YcfA (HicA-like mRNA interferase family)
VAEILRKLGFELVRQQASHQQFRDARGHCTTVPFHKGRDISALRLRQIAKDIGMTMEGFIANR